MGADSKAPLKYGRNVGKIRITCVQSKVHERHKTCFDMNKMSISIIQNTAMLHKKLNSYIFWPMAICIPWMHCISRSVNTSWYFESRRQAFLKDTTTFSEPLIRWLLLSQHFMNAIRSSRHITSSNSHILHTTCSPVKCFYLIHKEQLGLYTKRRALLQYFTTSNLKRRLEIITGHSPFSSYSA